MVTRAQKRAPDTRDVTPVVKRRNADVVEAIISSQETESSVFKDVNGKGTRSPTGGGIAKGSPSVTGAEADPPSPIVTWTTGKVTFEKEKAERPGFKIALWNVNGIRAVMNPSPIYQNKAPLLEYVKHEAPDILCLNETKIDDTQVANFTQSIPGYKGYFACSVKKGYAGVATYVRHGVNVAFEKSGLGIAEHDIEGRVQTLLVRPEKLPEFYLVNTYVVNASRGLVRLPYKLKNFIPALYKKDIAYGDRYECGCSHRIFWTAAHLNTLREKNPRVIWTGDLNVAHQEIDIWNSKGNLKSPGHTPEERKSFGDFLSGSGWTDVFRHFFPNKRQYTYWSAMQKSNLELNKGWRLDYYVMSDAILDLCEKIYTRDFVRGSDHCPIVALLRRSADVSTEEKSHLCDVPPVAKKGDTLAPEGNQPEKTRDADSPDRGEDTENRKGNADLVTSNQPGCEDPGSNSPDAEQEKSNGKAGVDGASAR